MKAFGKNITNTGIMVFCLNENFVCDQYITRVLFKLD